MKRKKMRTLTVVLAIITVTLTTSPAFAEYRYQYNKKGTGYWRDNSNDGNPYNNANYVGLNNHHAVPNNNSTAYIVNRYGNGYRYQDNNN